MTRSVVLLQVRDDPDAEEQERLCFLESCKLTPEELETINVVAEARFDKRRLHGADAVMIGGAGAHSATETYAFSEYLKEVIDELIDASKPIFASCFGHHFLARALGGDLVTDHRHGEIGTFEIELTDEGRRDPLLEIFPGRFPVQLGHHDVVTRIPDSMTELAFSTRCRFQMLRVAGKPVYCTQFHPELSDQHLRARLEMYRESYLAEKATEEEIAFPLGPSLWADKLLERFFQLYV